METPEALDNKSDPYPLAIPQPFYELNIFCYMVEVDCNFKNNPKIVNINKRIFTCGLPGQQ